VARDYQEPGQRLDAQIVPVEVMPTGQDLAMRAYEALPLARRQGPKGDFNYQQLMALAHAPQELLRVIQQDQDLSRSPQLMAIVHNHTNTTNNYYITPPDYGQPMSYPQAPSAPQYYPPPPQYYPYHQQQAQPINFNPTIHVNPTIEIDARSRSSSRAESSADSEYRGNYFVTFILALLLIVLGASLVSEN
jgi:hypothetical protein